MENTAASLFFIPYSPGVVPFGCLAVLLSGPHRTRQPGVAVSGPPGLQLWHVVEWSSMPAVTAGQ